MARPATAGGGAGPGRGGRRRDGGVVPRDGHTLRVVLVARISGCANQKEVSLDDQADHGRDVVLAEYGDGPVEYETIATRGKGERLDRPELDQIERLLRTRRFDLLVAEDLGRIVRGAEAVRLCGVAADHGTRVLAPNDCVDTADESWEEDVISACRDHVGHNAHTSKRLKHKLMNRFVKLGGSLPCEVFGYAKPPGCRTFHDLRRDDAATPVVRDLFERLLRDPNCSAAADWLNATGVPVGPYARRTSWDGKMVRRLVRNPVLKGTPGRGFRRTVKEHGSGRRVSLRSPDGPRFAAEPYPHLAHVDASTFHEVNALLAEKNADFSRKGVNGADPRGRVPRSRTRFPGQHATCGYCGRRYVWGGNGVTGNLMCAGSREWRCWNSVGFDGGRLARAVAAAIVAAVGELEGFDAQFRALLDEAARDGAGGLADARRNLLAAEGTLVAEQQNVGDAVAQCGLRPPLKQKLDELDARAADLARERARLDAAAGRAPRVPASAGELRASLAEQFARLAADSDEMAGLLRELAPDVSVSLVRLCDGGHPLPRARVRLDLTGSVPDAARVPGLTDLLTRELTFDLFDPPQRERIRAEAARLSALGLDQRAVGARIDGRPSQAAVSKALILDGRMRELRLDTPYIDVTAPPDDYPKLRRHRNPKYRFEPLPGHRRPAT